MDSYRLGVETHEQIFNLERTVCWREDQKMVVGSEQLEDSGDFSKGAHCIDNAALANMARMEARI